MSITIREEQKIFTTRRGVDKIKCELCEAVSVDEHDWKNGYDVGQVEVKLRVGNVFPEGDFTETTVLDICPGCFASKLIPWFESQGGKPRTYMTEDGPLEQT